MSTNQVFSVRVEGGELQHGRVVNMDNVLPDRAPLDMRLAAGDAMLAALVLYEAFRGGPTKTIPNIPALLDEAGVDAHDALFGTLALIDFWFCHVVDAFRDGLGAYGIELPMGMGTGAELGVKFQEELRGKLRELHEINERGSEDGK